MLHWPPENNITFHIQRKESQHFGNPKAPRSFKISTPNLREVVGLGQTKAL